jgi:RNA polymerase sigma factor (sigma-70 family)
MTVRLALDPRTVALGGRIVVTVRDMSTAALVEAATDGDRRAWDELVDRYGRLVYAVARGFRLSSADVADVFQTVWLRFAEHIGRLHEPARAGSWLATTTRHECLRVVRMAGRVVLVDEFDEPDPGDAAAVDPVVAAEERAALREAFSRLPERCRRLLAMVVDPGVDYDQICARLGMPKGSIGPTRGRCLAKLETELRAVYPVGASGGAG